MTPSPLISALLSVCFGFQLLLAGGGAMCVDADHGAMHAAGSADDAAMAGMDMDMPMPSSDGQAPCDQPSAPGACQLMGPCSGAFIAIAMADLEQPAVASSRVLSPTALPPLSRTVPPEPPPPRA